MSTQESQIGSLLSLLYSSYFIGQPCIGKLVSGVVIEAQVNDWEGEWRILAELFKSVTLPLTLYYSCICTWLRS